MKYPGNSRSLLCTADQLVRNGRKHRSTNLIVLAPEPPSKGSWYFAVSGDSRDCGDVIMPKIARAIANERKEAPVEFYWHLGDLRAIYRVDCDMAKRDDPSAKCAQDASKSEQVLMKNEKYVERAWQDFKDFQIKPFANAKIDFILGIGNHDVIPPKAQELFRKDFATWLQQKMLLDQWKLDHVRGIESPPGSTYFHFVKKGVDFISLDNADGGDPNSRDPDPTKGFSVSQLTWLERVLQADASDATVKTIIVGMHAALPFSVSRDHAMDNTCSSFCSGNKAYNLLDRVQASGKHVYLLASHSHYFEQDIYNTREHTDHVMPGWIVGTAGAEQYKPGIRYGYMLVKVKADGTIRTTFEDIRRNDLPAIDNANLLDYCFAKNRRPPAPEQPPTTVPLVKDGNFCRCK
jgi:hypothetical protein